MTRKPNECRTCRYHDDFSWVCFNGDSEYRADFTNPEWSCSKWEKRDGERTSSDVGSNTPRE